MHKCQINKNFWKEVEAEIAVRKKARMKQIKAVSDKRLLRMVLALDHIDCLEIMSSNIKGKEWNITFSLPETFLGWRSLTLIAWAIGKMRQRKKPMRYPNIELTCWASPNTMGLFSSCFEICAKNTDPNMLAKLIKKQVGK